MAIMSLSDWKRDTKRSCHSRSDLLKEVDKALDKYEKSSTRDNLVKLDTAFKAWSDSKADALTSIRNHKDAVTHLRDEIDAELLKIAPSVVFAPLRVVAVDKGAILKTGRTFKSPTTTTNTMTDDAQVTSFTDAVKLLWTQASWNGKTKRQRGEALIAAVAAVHTSCNIPNVGPDVKTLPPGYHGFFDFSTWKIQLSEDIFDFAFAPGNKAKLVNVAETVYHEARHCEQWFHMARYFALGKSAVDVAAYIGIPQVIADAAKLRQMTSDDKIHDKTEQWYESVYGTADRGITLGALALKRQAATVDMSDFHSRTYSAYSGGLPEEEDAWGIQLLVRAKL